MESTMESTLKCVEYRMKSIENMYKKQLDMAINSQMLDRKGYVVLEKLPELVRNFIENVEGVMCNSCCEKGYSEYITKFKHSYNLLFDPNALNKFESDILLWINKNRSIIVSTNIPLWSFSFHNNFFVDVEFVVSSLDNGKCPCPIHSDYLS